MPRLQKYFAAETSIYHDGSNMADELYRFSLNFYWANPTENTEAKMSFWWIKW